MYLDSDLLTMTSTDNTEGSGSRPSHNNEDTSPSCDIEQTEGENQPNTAKPSVVPAADTPDNEDDAATKARKRQERFKALQARAVRSL